MTFSWKLDIETNKGKWGVNEGEIFLAGPTGVLPFELLMHQDVGLSDTPLYSLNSPLKVIAVTVAGR